jgi:hypothetical protein
MSELQEQTDALARVIASTAESSDEVVDGVAAALYDTMSQLGVCPHCVIKQVVTLMEPTIMEVVSEGMVDDTEQEEMRALVAVFNLQESRTLN